MVRRVPLNQMARAGVTLVELLVSIGVVAMLLAILVPAVQNARERSRNVSCMNNLRQIGIAWHSVNDTHGVFPPVRNRFGRTRVIPPFIPADTEAYLRSAHYDLLPGLGLANVQASCILGGDYKLPGDPIRSFRNQLLLDQPVPVFQCPSDYLSHAAVSYLISHGTSSGGESTPGYSPPNTVLPGVANGVSSARITDGLSNTIAFSERLVGDHDSRRYSPARDWAWVPRLHQAIVESSPVLPETTREICRDYVGRDQPHASYNSRGWLFSSLGITSYNHVLPPNSAIADCATPGGGTGAYSARSLHPGGVNVLFADGSVRFLAELIDTSTWRALGTIRGGEAIE